MFKTWHKSTEMVLLYQIRVSSWFAWIVFSYVKRRSTNCDRQDWPGILRSNRQQAPIHYICADYIQPTTSAQNISLHFSVVLQFFLLSDIFPNISPPPSIAHVWNPNPCQFFPLDFFSSNVLLKNWSNMAACQMVRWTKKVGYGSAQAFSPNFQDNPTGT